jgi:hypothetical protein
MLWRSSLTERDFHDGLPIVVAAKINSPPRSGAAWEPANPTGQPLHLDPSRWFRGAYRDRGCVSGLEANVSKSFLQRGRPVLADHASMVSGAHGTGSIDIDAYHVAHRSGTGTVAGHDEPQPWAWQRLAVYMIGKLYGPVCELWRNLAECHDGCIAVGTDHAHGKVSFRTWCAGFDHLGGHQHVPKQRPAEFVMLITATGKGVDSLAEWLESRDSRGAENPRGLSGALDQ